MSENDLRQSGTDIEVTTAMLCAGLQCLYELGLPDDLAEADSLAVDRIYQAMAQSAHEEDLIVPL